MPLHNDDIFNITLLFIMFMNDMPLNVSASVDMYADDSTITATGKTTEAVEEKLNNDLHEVSKWCEENKMVINPEKTKIMLVTTRHKWQHLHKTDPDVQINDKNLQENTRGRDRPFSLLVLTRAEDAHHGC